MTDFPNNARTHGALAPLRLLTAAAVMLMGMSFW